MTDKCGLCGGEFVNDEPYIYTCKGCEAVYRLVLVLRGKVE